MAYGFDVKDSNGRTILDSELPVYAFEREVTLTAKTAVIYASYNRLGYYPWDPANPLRLAYFPGEYTMLPGSPSIGCYSFDTSSILASDPNSASAFLAFKIPVGGWAYYLGAANRVYVSNTQTSISVAVIKPASVLGIGTSGYGAAAYNSTGQVAWSSNWPVVGIQGEVGNKTIESSSYFILNPNTYRRALNDGTSGYGGQIGIRRTTATTIFTSYFVLGNPTSPYDGYGADTHNSPGLVLNDIII